MRGFSRLMPLKISPHPELEPQASSRRALAALATFFIFALVASASAETLKIGKPAPIDYNFAMPEIGTGAGIFARHGIELEVVSLAGSAKLHQAMVAHAHPEMGKTIYDVEMPAFSDDGRFDPAAVKVVLDSLLDMKQLDSIPDTKTLFTEEFLPPRR